MIHTEPHPLAGQTVEIKIEGETLEYRLEDWWDRVHGSSWMFADGNPAALKYAMRAGFAGLPVDDEVVYAKVDIFGHLIHASEIVSATGGPR
ncbi:hypothetical protein [Rhodococcus erythropolis]|uniref:Uncharacterized protein n=1 Tax=Rhodococcus erythropolis (strain PR4 / NBRC 100887) TaxID=234621 RepID=C0ZXB2_RHOE4|nr:hypothetical protein [Rhodococcus erythropolis]BAH32997.1 hypothetical protein RER_22890 [Rhodococcus erythropolis PR4]